MSHLTSQILKQRILMRERLETACPQSYSTNTEWLSHLGTKILTVTRITFLH